MKTQRLYVNVYRSGHYHRQGKPGHCNIHAGDLFTSEDLALENAEPGNGYIATVPLDMPIPDDVTILANPQGSIPSPLRQTRDNPLALMPWHSSPEVFPVAILSAGQACALPLHEDATSLEVGDDVLGMSYAEWKREREKTGFKPLPQPHQVAALLAAPTWRDARPQGFSE